MDDVERRLFIFRSAHSTSGNLPCTRNPQGCGVHFERIRLAPHACPLSLGSYMILRMPLENKKHKTQ